MDTAYILDGESNLDAVTVTERASDGFVWVKTSNGETLRLTPSEVFDTAYAAGRFAGCRRGMHVWNDVADFDTAARSWKGAEGDHAQTSFYGAARVRQYRAYWLGRLRTARGQYAALRG